MEDNNYKILVFDDNSKNIQVVASLLSENDYLIEFALSGAEALQWAKKHNFDLILLDIMMPEMDGFEVCEKLKNEEKNKDLPIIFLTAKTDVESITKAFTKGGYDYLTKPFNSEELLARVKTHVEFKRSKEQLANNLEKEKELGLLKSRFLSTAAHQFRTPLTVIQTNMDILDFQKENLNDLMKPRFEKANNRIIAQIKKMTDLMDDVLTISKLSSGGIQTSFKNEDIVNICEEIIVLYNEISEDKRKMQIIIKGNPVEINIDSKLFMHSISNLVSNAFKYSEGSPAPEMMINFTEKKVKISVIDHGMGIPEDDLKHLFEPFFRASNVTKLEGTGLGIAISREYIELNGGTLDVKSVLNKGTEFTVSLSK